MRALIEKTWGWDDKWQREDFQKRLRECQVRVIEVDTKSAGALWTQAVFDKATLQSSYDEHLARLGLLSPRYAVDHRTRLPEFDRRRGAQRLQGYELSALGHLLLRQVGIETNRA